MGQTLTLTVGVTNPGLSGTGDFYLGTLRPDSTVEFFTATGVAVGTLAAASYSFPRTDGVSRW